MTKNAPSMDRPNPPASRPSVILDKETARHIFRALLLTIVFAWQCFHRFLWVAPLPLSSTFYSAR